MKPKEKAKELYEKYYNIQGEVQWDTTTENKEKAENFNNELGEDVDLFWVELAKQSSIIAVNEILHECWDIREIDLEKSYDYWIEVKQEIKKL